MTVDFPIGTRLCFDNKTLEIVEDYVDFDPCDQCVLHYAERGEFRRLFVCKHTLHLSLWRRKARR